MRVRLTPTHCQARVQEQDAAICPWCEEAALVGRGLVFWIVDLECFVDVLEGRGSGCRWTDGEAEAVGLVRAVVRVLPCDDDLDRVEWCVS